MSQLTDKGDPSGIVFREEHIPDGRPSPKAGQSGRLHPGLASAPGHQTAPRCYKSKPRAGARLQCLVDRITSGAYCGAEFSTRLSQQRVRIRHSTMSAQCVWACAAAADGMVLAPPNANAREFQRDVDSCIVFHGCPPSPDASGRLNVVTPFHHLPGDSHLHRSLGAGPITASSSP